MKTIKTYPNIILILVNLIVLFFLTSLVFFLFSAMLKIENGLYLIFPLTLNIFVLVFFYYQLVNHLIFISINNDGIKIYQLLKFKTKKLLFKEFNGYSISEVKFGKNLFSSKSLVLYTKTNGIFEIIKLFNLNFNNVLESLNEIDIIKLGKEPYQTGILLRKYKYITKTI